MSYQIGNTVKVSVFGQSHAPCIGMTMEGFPDGFKIDTAVLSAFMDRRRPGKNNMSTSRSEADAPEWISGLTGDGVTCGAPLCAVIRNTNTRSSDYETLRLRPRPGHADYTAYVKFGANFDGRGGGSFSGRMTAPVCAAGGICKQYLEKQGIFIHAKADRIAGIADKEIPCEEEIWRAVSEKELPVFSETQERKMRDAIEQARLSGDSVGGCIACTVFGLPAGLGDALFGGLESRLSAALFGIPGVKGVEFGDGFAVADRLGSENNDAFFYENGTIRTKTNHCGGILGGISDGMPLTFRLAVKPTPSIAKPQMSVNLQTGQNEELIITGRHDPCIVPRAVPVAEAVAAIILTDCMEEQRNGTGRTAQ